MRKIFKNMAWTMALDNGRNAGDGGLLRFAG